MKTFAATLLFASAQALRIKQGGTAGTAGTAADTTMPTTGVVCPAGEVLSTDGSHCMPDPNMTAPCPSGQHMVSGMCVDQGTVPAAGTYRVDEVETAIQEAYWGWCDDFALQQMSQGWWEDWQLLESIGQGFKDTFEDEWGWVGANASDCAAYLTSVSPDSLVDQAISNMQALKTRREQPGYWDAYHDGSMQAWFYSSKYSEENREHAFNDGVEQGVFDAKSAMFGAMARPNWNETWDASWNGTNGTNSTNATTWDCPSGTTCM